MARPKRIIMCPRCGEEKEHFAKGLCAKCYYASKRAKPKNPAICPYCGIRPLSKKGKTCGSKKCLNERTKELVREAKNNGICVVCMKNPALPGRTRCEACSKDASQRSMASAKRRRPTPIQKTEKALYRYAKRIGHWPTCKEWDQFAVGHGYYSCASLCKHTKINWEEYREKFGWG